MRQDTCEAIKQMYGQPRELFIETSEFDVYGWTIYNTNLEPLVLSDIEGVGDMFELYFWATS